MPLLLPAQIRELLIRIPPSPETDELQNVLESQAKFHAAEIKKGQGWEALAVHLGSDLEAIRIVLADMGHVCTIGNGSLAILKVLTANKR